MHTIESAHALARTPNGDIYVAGRTVSFDFPGISQSSFDGSFYGGHEGFVVRLDANLTTILASTFLGGDGGEQIDYIAVDPVYGSILVAGDTTSTDFPGVSCQSPSADCVAEYREGLRHHPRSGVESLRRGHVCRRLRGGQKQGGNRAVDRDRPGGQRDRRRP